MDLKMHLYFARANRFAGEKYSDGAPAAERGRGGAGAQSAELSQDGEPAAERGRGGAGAQSAGLFPTG